MNQQQNEYFRSAVPAAQQTARIYGVPASITLAQGALESGWGASALARKANNYFGIKATAHATAEEYCELPTSEFVDGRKRTEVARFARYATPAESFQSHALLLSRGARYALAMAVKNDPAKFAAALQKCGYSTNPSYASLLMSLVKQFDLTQYDVPTNPEPAAPAKG